MFSPFRRGIPNGVAVRILGLSNFQRVASTAPAASKELSIAEHKSKIEALLSEDLPKPYDGPERDHVNFPRRKRLVQPGQVRMGFLPDNWFQFFYKKTGVTGPYMFGGGLLTFLLSKELYVIEHEFSTGCAIFILVYIAMKKFGPAGRIFLDKMHDDEAADFNNMKSKNMSQLEGALESEKKNVWQSEGQKILIEAKKENVQMQLETEYRRRMMHVYEQIKKRLDYQLDYYNTRRKLEQTHLVEWVVNNVVKSITPQQEKEALQKCIEDLKVLSTQSQPA